MQKAKELELVIIGGPYKSGTSLLCESIEALGYANPGNTTNPFEHGHGIQIGLYQTRECSLARNWNRELVFAGANDVKKAERKIVVYLQEMTEELGPLLVIKDPYMKLTAPHWFRSAQKIGASKLTYLQTERDIVSVKKSWENSRFLTQQKHGSPDVFTKLISPIDLEILKELSSLGVKTARVKYGASITESLRVYIVRRQLPCPVRPGYLTPDSICNIPTSYSETNNQETEN